MNWRRIFWLVLRVGLGGVLMGASYYKIMSPGAFAHEVYNYKMLPPWAINPFAITLPWMQFLCGVALILNVQSFAAALWAVVMFFSFQTAVGSALFRGLNISCGCFKSGGSPATWITFSRDSLFFVVAVLNAWHFWRERQRTEDDGA